MIKFIDARAVLPLRNVILRNNIGLEGSVFLGDEDPDTFHLGYLLNNDIVCVASFYRKDLPGGSASGYQLRGMATATAHSGKGYGAELINFAINYLRNKGAGYIWCNARTSAAGFYKKIGFELTSEEFNIENIGPHFQMCYPLTNNPEQGKSY